MREPIAVLRATREAVQPSLWDRLVNDLPGVASEIAGLVDASLQRVGLYQQKIHVLSEMNKTIACSVNKAKRVLGYRPHVALEEGMRRSLQWTTATYGPL